MKEPLNERLYSVTNASGTMVRGEVTSEVWLLKATIAAHHSVGLATLTL